MRLTRRGAGMGAALALFAAAAGGGCAVGKGNGSVSGPIFVIGCYSDGTNYGKPAVGPVAAPVNYNLNPTFFAGEPIDGIANGPNRVLIRLQRSGNGIEIDDTVYIDVQDTFEVARCVRGRTINGVPDYDTSGWCDWSGAGTTDGGLDASVADAGADAAIGNGVADGGPDAGVPAMTAARARIHLSDQGIVRSSMALLFTCHDANLVGLAVDGFIDFLDFGTAAQPDLPPDMRTAVDPDFKINFDDRLRASFHDQLGDQRVITAAMELMAIPAPKIGGQLDGFFDFDLQRGRGAQPFP